MRVPQVHIPHVAPAVLGHERCRCPEPCAAGGVRCAVCSGVLPGQKSESPPKRAPTPNRSQEVAEVEVAEV